MQPTIIIIQEENCSSYSMSHLGPTYLFRMLFIHTSNQNTTTTVCTRDSQCAPFRIDTLSHHTHDNFIIAVNH